MLRPISRGPLGQEIPNFKCHGDQCEKGCTELGPRERQQMGATKAPVGDGSTHALGTGDHGRGCPQVHTYLINLLDPPINAIKGPAVGDVIYQEDPL